jgi:hypothetical protein
MAANTNDESDLTFHATIDLNTLPVDAEAPTARPADRSRTCFCTRSFWTNHATLLYRVALFIFLTLLITLLETLFPGKIGTLTKLLDTLVRQNVTIDN